MKRVIAAAEDAVNPLDELRDTLEDDFSYFLAGVEKLQRDGSDASREVYSIAIDFNDALQSAIARISDYIGE